MTNQIEALIADMKIESANNGGIFLHRPDIAILIAALEQSQHRVDELENDEVRQRLANAEHQLHMAGLRFHNIKASRNAQYKKRKAAEKRIAELETSQVAVKLPRVAAVMWHLSDQAKHRTTAENVNDVLDAIRATGGTVQGDE